jgi:hypothetical protein
MVIIIIMLLWLGILTLLVSTGNVVGLYQIAIFALNLGEMQSLPLRVYLNLVYWSSRHSNLLDLNFLVACVLICPLWNFTFSFLLPSFGYWPFFFVPHVSKAKGKGKVVPVFN